MRPGNAKRSVGKLAATTVIVLFSILVSLLLGEATVRLALDEIDYLTPTLIQHDHLVHAIKPGSGGHDSFGFRNNTVPENAEILAIGDSQTYGVSATSKKSWPAQLNQIMGAKVYNLGIGGYGPIDYLYLFNNYINIFEPRVVIVAFYFGNDLVDAYSAVREKFSEGDGEDLHSTDIKHPLRHWLSQNSLLYQITKVELATLTSAIRRREATSSGNDLSVLFPYRGKKHVFQPEYRQSMLDLTKEKNRIGLEISLDVISQIGVTCAARPLECYFLLIPTKEACTRILRVQV